MIWFTSDLHFGHANVIDFCNRPFHPMYTMVHGSEDIIELASAVDDMNYQLIENWNSCVQTDDMVIILGDFAMGKIADTLPLANELNGRKWLFPGNHDRCWFAAKKFSPDWLKKYHDVGLNTFGNGAFPSSWDLTHLFDDVTDRPVSVSHFPFYGDSHDEDRYSQYRPHDYGQWLLHGHTHSNERVNGRMIHVGVDAWDYHPVSIDQIKELMK